MRIMKFGGSSVGDKTCVRRMTAIVRRRVETGEPLALVFSAVGDTTDSLTDAGLRATRGQLDRSLAVLSALENQFLGLVRDLVKAEGERRALVETCEGTFRTLRTMARGIAALEDLSPPVQDRLLQYGELLTTRILARVLREEGIPARWVDARDFIVTDDRFTHATPKLQVTESRCRRLLQLFLRQGAVPVTQGFIGRSETGALTTLGRGGSDTTAALLGAALGADEIEIWTDVEGIMTADPSLVDAAENIPAMSFREAAELAFFGARVLYPGSLEPAMARSIPVRVFNTTHPGGPGTVILPETPDRRRSVKSIAYKEGMTLVKLDSPRMFRAHDFLRRVFEILERHELAPHILATSEVSVAMAIWEASGLRRAVPQLETMGKVTVSPNKAVVCAVGDGLGETPGIVAEIFHDLRRICISLVSQGASSSSLGFVVDEEDLPFAIRRLHRRFFEGVAERGEEMEILHASTPIRREAGRG